MATYKVGLRAYVDTEVEVEADNEEEAWRLALCPTMAKSATPLVVSSQVQRYEIAMPDPDSPFPDEPWIDRLRAIREPSYNLSVGSDSHDGYWLICGDNTGSQSLVVHDYMIEPLIELLRALPRTEVDG